MKLQILGVLLALMAALAYWNVNASRLHSLESEIAEQENLLTTFRQDVRTLEAELEIKTEEEKNLRQRIQQITEARNRAEARARSIEASYEKAKRDLESMLKEDPAFEEWVASPAPSAAIEWLCKLRQADPHCGY